MKNSMKSGYLKLTSLILALMIGISIIPISGSATGEAEAAQTEGTVKPAVEITDSTGAVYYCSSPDEATLGYDKLSWITGDLTVTLSSSDYADMQGFQFRKTPAENVTDEESGWVNLSTENGGTVATADEADTQKVNSTVSFTLAAKEGEEPVNYGGAYDIRFKESTDKNAGYINVEKVFFVKMDNSGPTVSCTADTTDWTNEVTISGNISDEYSGVKEVYYYLGDVNGKTAVTYENGKYSFMVNKSYNDKVTVAAIDNAGNESTTTVAVKVDADAPEVSILTPSDDNWTKDSVTITAEVNDKGDSGISGVYYKAVNGFEGIKPDSLNPSDDTKIADIDADGNYAFTLEDSFSGLVAVYAVDGAGNISYSDNKTLTAKVNIDKEECIIANLSVNPSDWSAGAVEVTGTISDNLSGVKEDSYKYIIYKSGETNSGAWSVLSGEYKNGEFTISQKFNEDGKMDFGEYTLEIKAEDNAQNGSTLDSAQPYMTYPLTIKIDNEVPTINEASVTYSNNQAAQDKVYTNGSVTITGTIEYKGPSGLDVNSVEIKQDSDGAEWDKVNSVTDNGNATYTYTYTIPAQTYIGSYSVQAKSNAVSSVQVDSEVATVYMDTTAPKFDEESINVTSLKWAKSVTVSGTVTDVDSGIKSVKYRKSGTEDDWQEATLTLSEDKKSAEFSFTVSDGLYNGTFDLVCEDNAGTVTDTAGNTAELNGSKKTKVQVDNTAPVVGNVSTEVSFTDAEGKPDTSIWTNKDVVFTGTVSDTGSGAKQVNYSFTDDEDYADLNGTAEVKEDGSFEFTVSAETLSIAKGKKGGYVGNIKITAVDNAGNVTAEENAASVYIQVDTEDGTIVIADYPKGWQNEDIEVTITFYDVNGGKESYISGFSKILYRYVTDSEQKYKEIEKENISKTEDGTGYTYTFTFPKADFAEEIEVKFVDNAGNEKTVTFDIKQDITAPMVESATLNTTEWTNDEVKISGQVTDNEVAPLNYNSGIAAVYYKKSIAEDIDNNWEKVVGLTLSEDKLSADYTISLSADDYCGTYEIKVKDNAGNYSDIFTTDIIKQDKTAPDSISATPDKTEWTNGEVTISGNVSDKGATPSDYNSGISAVYYKKSTLEDSYENWKQITDVTKSNDGLRADFKFILSADDYNGTYTIKAVDNAGNESYADMKNGVVSQDKTAPIVADKPVIDPTAWTNGEVTITGTFSDVQTNYNSGVKAVYYKKSTAEDTEENWQSVEITKGIEVKYEITLPPDNYEETYDIKAVDNAGNVSDIVKTGTVKQDITGPNIVVEKSEPVNVWEDLLTTITFGAYGKGDNKELSFTLSITDNLSGIDFDSLTMHYSKLGEIEEIISAENTFFNKTNSTITSVERDETKSNSDNKCVNATVSFTINGEKMNLNTPIWFTVNDTVGNKSGECSAATPDEYVIDTNAPSISAQYSTYRNSDNVSKDENDEAIISKDSVLYYTNESKIKITISEDNFFPEDINSTSDELKNIPDCTIKVTKDGEEIKDGFELSDWTPVNGENTATLTIGDKTAENGIYDGTYVVTVNYQDRSANTAEQFTSAAVILDSTAPNGEISNYSDCKNEYNEKRYYSDSAQVTLSVDERYFYSEDINSSDDKLTNVANCTLKVTKDGKEITSYDISDWESNGSTNTATITFKEEGTYTVEMQYQDRSENKMNLLKSSTIIVDKTAPYGNIDYNTCQNEYNGTRYYNDNAQVTLNVDERYFYSEDINSTNDSLSNVPNCILKVTKDGKEITSYDISDWKTNNSANTATITFKEEGIYTVEMQYQDRSENKMNTLKSATIVVDKTAPTGNISYNKSAKAINDMGQDVSESEATVIYYKNNAEVTIDITERYFYSEDINSTNDKLTNTSGCVLKVTKDGENYTDYSITDWTTNGTKNTATITLAEEGTYVVEIQYQDRSNKPMEALTSATVIVDETAPNGSVSYREDEYKGVYTDEESKLTTYYYNSDATLTFSVTETNFNKEDVTFTVTRDGKKYTDYAITDWSANGTQNTSTITLAEEGTYTVNMIYQDRSQNDTVNLNSATIVVDRTKPEGEITYSKCESETDSTRYYKDTATVTLSIEERYFYSEDINNGDSSLKNVENCILKVTKDGKEYTDYAITDWTSRGITNTATITFADEGTYTVEMTYQDRSQNTPMELKSATIVIDSTAPDGDITYSNCENETDSTRYYKNAAKVTLGIDERYFYSEDINSRDNCTLTVTKDGKEHTDYAITDWTSSGITNTATISFTDEGTYTVAFKYQDRSLNDSIELKSATIVIDRTAPDGEITYSNCENETDSTRYYKNAAKVTLSIDKRYFYSEDINNGDSTLTNVENCVLTVTKDGEEYTGYGTYGWGATGTTHTKDIILSVEGTYTISFIYQDRSLNAPVELKSKTIIVDRTAPDGSFTYSEAKNSYGGTEYYSSEANVTINITERYFYSEDVNNAKSTFKNAQNCTIKVTKDGKEITDYDISKWNSNDSANTATITFKDEGTYTVEMQYQDRSMNSVMKITSEEVVIDKTAPTRTVTYSTPERAVDSSSKDVDFNKNVEGSGTTLYYSGKAEVTVDITERYFYSSDIYDSNYNLRNTSDCVLTVTKDGRQYNDYSASNWADSGNKHSIKITFSDEGDYVVKLSYRDRSMNTMKSLETATIIVDKTNPTIKVQYGNKDVKNEIDGRSYFADKQSAVITVTEKNFRASDVKISVKAVDSDGNSVDSAYTKGSWTTVGNVHTLTIQYSEDANYSFDVTYEDLARRSISDYKQDSFTVDRKAPGAVRFSYSASVLNTLINTVTFGYYDNPVTVTLTCYDATSGVYEFDYTGILAPDASSINREIVKTAVSSAQITRNGGTATVAFTIPQSALTALNSFNGTVTASAVDRSGNSTETSDSHRIIADNIAPVGSVEINSPVSSVNGFDYYGDDITLDFTITEANFYAEDVVFIADGSAQTLSWSSSGDVHTATYVITEEGEHNFSLNYTDRSGNKMEEVSNVNTLVIDRTAPVITVSKDIKNSSANNGDTITLTVTVDDKYFDASGIKPVLEENIISGNDVDPDKQISALTVNEVTLDNPQKSGTAYIYTIDNVKADGFYRLTCSAKDYANNQSAKLNCTGSDDKEQSVDTFSFSVNRKGSSFWVETKNVKNGNYTNSEDITVKVHEINVDMLNNDAALKIIRDNDTKKVSLTKDNYSANNRVGENGWYESVYTLKNSEFEEDSEYSVVLTTKDRAGNINISSDNDVSLISFIVDRTAPVITSNLSDGQIINSENFTVEFKITENNMNPETLTVKLNGKEVTDYQEKGGAYNFTMAGSSGRQKLEITVNDFAGNKSEEYVINDITISTNLFVLWYANKLLFWGSIGLFAVAVGLIIFFIVRRKKKSS